MQRQMAADNDIRRVVRRNELRHAAAEAHRDEGVVIPKQPRRRICVARPHGASPSAAVRHNPHRFEHLLKRKGVAE